MKSDESNLDRLLRSAAQAEDQSRPEMPFGFDTRVLALARSTPANGNGVATLARRVALIAACVIVVASAAVYRQAAADADADNDLGGAYAMADSAIESALSQ